MQKLAVCTPWASPFMFTGYSDSQLNLRHPTGWAVRYIRGVGWCPARRHIDLCEKALAWGADWICILGADQQHPEDLLPRLVARVEEGYDVISALVPARGYVGWQGMQPFQRMAWRFQRPHTVGMEAVNALAATLPAIEAIDPAAGDVQEINFIGSGVLMFHREHLLALRQPWFAERFDPLTYERLASMDTTFVWRLQAEAGAHVYVDTTIAVRHLHIFPIDETYSARFADWAEPGKGDPAICVYAPGGQPYGHKDPAVEVQASPGGGDEGSPHGRALDRGAGGREPGPEGAYAQGDCVQ